MKSEAPASSALTTESWSRTEALKIIGIRACFLGPEPRQELERSIVGEAGVQEDDVGARSASH